MLRAMLVGLRGIYWHELGFALREGNTLDVELEAKTW